MMALRRDGAHLHHAGLRKKVKIKIGSAGHALPGMKVEIRSIPVTEKIEGITDGSVQEAPVPAIDTTLVIEQAGQAVRAAAAGDVAPLHALYVIARDALEDLDGAVDVADLRLALGHAGLEQLLHAGQAGRDVGAGHATGVERPHRQLRARLADGLGRDDADCLTDLDELARGEVSAVAGAADAQA